LATGRAAIALLSSIGEIGTFTGITLPSKKETTMPPSYAGRVTFARVSTDEMWLHLTDDATHIEVLRLKISLEDFARMITGQAERPCTFTMRPEHLGHVAEYKYEIVPYVASHPRGSMAERATKRAALTPWEVDGWQGDASNLGNMHRGSTEGYRVLFTRYVTQDAAQGDDDAEPCP
jgi:hypothetical protein